MASDARPSTVRLVALAVSSAVVLGGLGVLAWSDEVGSRAVRPLWDRATGDARVLLLFDGPLVVVIGALIGTIAVALVAWNRERTRSNGSEPRPSVGPGAARADRSARELLEAWKGSGRLGLLFAALVALGASFAGYGTIESIWGEPSLRLSLLTLGGAGAAVAAVVGPAVAGTAGGDRRGVRHATVVLVSTLVLFALVVSLLDRSGALSIEDARRRLGGDGPGGSSSPTVEDYYQRLYGPSLGAEEFVITGNGEIGMVVVLARDAGYADADLGRLNREARQFGLPSTSVLVHRGLAIILFGSVGGLESGSGEDRRARVRQLLDG